MSLELFANTPTPSSPSTPWTVLSGALTDVATAVTFLDGSVFPTAVSGVSQYRILIDDEIIIVTNSSGDDATITRGAEGTTAAAHADGASVYHIVTAAAVGNLSYISSTATRVANTVLAGPATGPDAPPTFRSLVAADIPDISATYATPASVISYVGSNYVPLSRTVAGKALSSDITLTPSDLSSLGTGVATALGVNVGSAGAFVVNGGALGTPSSGTLTSATGLPISTGVSGLGTGVATFLATPSSANLAAAVTDETGSGALVFATSPTLSSATNTAALALTPTTTMWEMPGTVTGEGVRFSFLYAKNNLGSYFDDVVSWGWNQGNVTATALVAGQPSLFETMEHKYDPGGGSYQSEWHQTFLDTSAVAHRFASWSLKFDGTSGSKSEDLTTIAWNNWAGTLQVQWNLTSNNVSLGSSTTGFTFVQQKNNVQWLKQSNAANNASLTMAYIDSDDRMRLYAPIALLGSTPTTGTYATKLIKIQSLANVANDAVVSITGASNTGDLNLVEATASATGYARYVVTNSSNTSAADAVMEMVAGGTSGGDPQARFRVSGGATWYVGSDNSDSDKFTIATNVFSGASNWLQITTTGKVGISQATPTAWLHLGAGTATASTAPLKFTSGTNLTTAEAGAMEYNGTNLFFTRAGTTRENVLVSSAVNSVSPTSPNRTLTVNIGGTDYYISAKTTND